MKLTLATTLLRTEVKGTHGQNWHKLKETVHTLAQIQSVCANVYTAGRTLQGGSRLRWDGGGQTQSCGGWPEGQGAWCSLHTCWSVSVDWSANNVSLWSSPQKLCSPPNCLCRIKSSSLWIQTCTGTWSLTCGRTPAKVMGLLLIWWWYRMKQYNIYKSHDSGVGGNSNVRLCVWKFPNFPKGTLEKFIKSSLSVYLIRFLSTWVV